jgi:hypothetical protein
MTDVREQGVRLVLQIAYEFAISASPLQFLKRKSVGLSGDGTTSTEEGIKLLRGGEYG